MQPKTEALEGTVLVKCRKSPHCYTKELLKHFKNPESGYVNFIGCYLNFLIFLH